jgi:thioredoxin 1
MVDISSGAVMIYFGGENCSVCKSLKPKVEELFNTKFPNITQHYIQSDDNLEFARRHNVFTIPTLLIFFDGKEYIRESRHISLHTLEPQISKLYSMFFD